jgi:rare lipoprotein A (peptidoglycan hydrolase)
MSRQVSYIKFNEDVSDNISFSQNYLRREGQVSNTLVSLVSGSATSSPTYGFSGESALGNLQNAAADSQTKGIATFYDAQFDSTSGLITLDTLDGGEYD